MIDRFGPFCVTRRWAALAGVILAVLNAGCVTGDEPDLRSFSEQCEASGFEPGTEGHERCLAELRKLRAGELSERAVRASQSALPGSRARTSEVPIP